jgi:hypothetical protein
MSASQTLAQLERQCRELGVRLIYDELRGEGGLCRLHDSYIVVINRRAAVETRVKLLSEALLAVEQRPIVAQTGSDQVVERASGQVVDTGRTEAAEPEAAVVEPLVEEFAHRQ